MATFNELGLSEVVLSALEQMGFESATSIQAEAIPVAMQGHDVIGQAQTGTGKTVAFGIPLVEKTSTDEHFLQCLVLTPTRELCIQVAEEVSKIGIQKRVRSLAIYGGQDITRQIRALRNQPHIVVATPGRLMDHMNRGTIKLSSITTVVLDEADEMLDMGFIEDIESILKQCPQERQTMLFSATMKRGVRDLARKFMKPEAVTVTVKATELTMPTITQEYYEVPERQKLDVLTRLLDIHNPELAIVFGRTKRRVDELVRALQTRGYDADGLHGDLSQRQRDNVMHKFREGNIDVLIATDVAARGIDVSGVTHVYNFDMPQDIDGYVHRIGRTGRAGQSGLASTFVTPREVEYLHVIERTTKGRIRKQALPTIAEARAGKQRVAFEVISRTLEEDLGGFKSTAEELLEQYDSLDLVAAALKLLSKNTNEVPVRLTAEEPVRLRVPRGGGGRDGGQRRDYRGGGGGGRDRDRRYGGGDRGGYGDRDRNRGGYGGDRGGHGGDRGGYGGDRGGYGGDRGGYGGDRGGDRGGYGNRDRRPGRNPVKGRTRSREEQAERTER